MKKSFLRYSLLIVIIMFFSFNKPLYAHNIGTSTDTVRAGFFYAPGFYEIDENNNLSGYGYEVMQYINQITAWDLECVPGYYTYEELLKMLNSDEIDIIVGAFSTIDDKRDYSLSELDIGNSAYKLLVRQNDDRFDNSNYSEWPTIRVGYFYYNDIVKQFTDFAKENNIKYELVNFNYSKDKNYLLNDKIDAFIISGFDSTGSNEKVIAYFGNEYKYLLTRNEDTLLNYELNDAIEAILTYDPDLFAKLKNKYFQTSVDESIRFTHEEREYIKNHKDKTIKAVVYGNLQPFHYYDNGEYKGIIYDYINLINSASGLNIEIETVSNYDSYVYAVRRGNADICADFIYSFNNSREFGVRLTEPYINVSASYVYNASNNISNNKIGIYDTLYYSQKNYSKIAPDKEFISYNSITECLDAVTSNEIEGALIPSYSARSYINGRNYNLLQYYNVPEYESSFSLAVINEDDITLSNIISKTVYFIGDSVFQDMIVKYLDSASPAEEYTLKDYIQKNYWVVWVFACFFIAVVGTLCVLLIRNYRNKQEKLLASQTNEKFIAILSANITAVEIEDIETSMNIYSYRIDENNKVIRKHEDFDYLLQLNGKIHPDDLYLVKDIFSVDSIAKYSKDNNYSYKEIRIAYKDNDPTYYYIGVTVSYIDSPDSNKILILYKDIDSAKKDEEEKRYTLQMALDTAKSYGNLRNTFLSQITHDLRTPMNAIMGMTTIAQLNIDDKNKVTECLDTISNSSDHLFALLNDILDVTRIESGKFTFNQKRVRIKNVLKNSIEMLSKRAKDNDIELIIDDSEIIHDHILADSTRLEQVFGNIISNAIKYSGTNNKVEVTLKETTKPGDSVYYYDFIVKDYGIGMSPKTLANLYTPFERGDESKFAEGTGLGMTITKSIIEAMGGIISVKSVLHEGTTFTINLSFSDETINSLSNIPQLAGKNALIISEDNKVGDLLSAIFEEGNMRCITMKEFELSDVFIENEFVVIATFFNETLDESSKKLVQLRNIVGKDTIIANVIDDDTKIVSSFINDMRVDGIVSVYNCKEEIIRLISDVIDSKKLSKKIKIESTLTGKRALIVEDVEINAIFAKAISDMKGLESDIAENGKIALDMLDKCDDGYYDIIFMDLHMPVMDGFITASLIRNSGRKYLINIPIIAMSANTFPEDIIRCKKVGMDDYISKPIDINVFSEITEKYIK